MVTAGNQLQTPVPSPIAKDSVPNARKDPSALNSDRQGRYSGARTVRKRRIADEAHSDDDSRAVETRPSNVAIERPQVRNVYAVSLRPVGSNRLLI